MEEEPAKERKPSQQFENYKKDYKVRCKWRGSVNVKLDMSAPFRFFLTGVNQLPETFDEDLTITFPELLDPSLGQLVHSLHVNYMVELPWLLAQYALNDLANPSMTILYGVDDDDLCCIPPHLRVTAVRIRSPYAFGHHHTKLSVFFYSDKSVRFAVYTANLIESDWSDRSQGVWVSPKCPYLGDNVPINYGESETLFKVDILQYLNSYRLPELRTCLAKIQESDCSSIGVFLVASVPGDRATGYGYQKLGKLLRDHCSSEWFSTSHLVFQCSSIGSLGPRPDSWLLGEFARSLSGERNCKVSVVYPSVDNVRRSIHGLLGGACLPYSSGTHERQSWLKDHFKQWKCDRRRRSRAVPHIKTYAGASADGDRLSWFLLTSANLSKAAWGRRGKTGLLRMMSYEAGVLFIPSVLVGKTTFSTGTGSGGGDSAFPLPYDWPLSDYRSTDHAFLYDRHFPRS